MMEIQLPFRSGDAVRSVRAAIGAGALVICAATACQTTTTKTVVISESKTPTPKSTQQTNTQPPASSSAAVTALGVAGTAECKQRVPSGCTDFPNPMISMAYPDYGFSGPFSGNYGGAYFRRSSTASASWTLVWAAGPGPYSCSNSYPIPSPIMKDLGGCF